MNKEIQRAEEAKRVLAEPLLQESFTAVESAIFTELRRVDVGARDRQRDLVVTLQLLGKLKQYLENTMLTGEMVRIQEERGSWTDRLKRNRG
jgi:hypothetical protein